MASARWPRPVPVSCCGVEPRGGWWAEPIWTDESTRLLPDPKPTGSLENSEPPALPAPKGQVMARRLENQQPTLPIPYRVHSFGSPQRLEEAGTLIPRPSPAEQEKGRRRGKVCRRKVT